MLREIEIRYRFCCSQSNDTPQNMKKHQTVTYDDVSVHTRRTCVKAPLVTFLAMYDLSTGSPRSKTTILFFERCAPREMGKWKRLKQSPQGQIVLWSREDTWVLGVERTRGSSGPDELICICSKIACLYHGVNLSKRNPRKYMKIRKKTKNPQAGAKAGFQQKRKKRSIQRFSWD